MELIVDLWEFAPGLRLKLLLLSLVAMMTLIIVANLRMSKARFGAAKAGRIKASDYAIVGKEEPDDLAVHTRLIVNLYELPPVFMILVLAFATAGVESWLTVLLAWLFVFLRWRHGSIMTNGNRVMKRRKIFVRSVQVFLVMMVEFAISILFFADL